MNINKSKVSVLVLLAAASVMLARGPGGGEHWRQKNMAALGGSGVKN